MNKERGVSLVTLIITIIVLLILAGISVVGIFSSFDKNIEENKKENIVSNVEAPEENIIEEAVVVETIEEAE